MGTKIHTPKRSASSINYLWLIAAALSSAFAWVWLFMSIDVSFWNPYNAIAIDSRALQIIWCLSFSALIIPLCHLKCKKIQTVWVLYLLVALGALALHYVAIGIVGPAGQSICTAIYGVLIGAGYALFFRSWAQTVRGANPQLTLLAAGIGLLGSAVLVFMLVAANAFSSAPALVVTPLGCIALQYVSKRHEPIRSVPATATRQMVRLLRSKPARWSFLLMVIGAITSVELQAMLYLNSTFPAIEWAIGSLLSACIILVSHTSIASSTRVFTITNIIICLSVIVSMFVENQLIAWGSLAIGMAAFWLLFATILAIPSIDAENPNNKSDALKLYAHSFVAFFLTIVIWSLAGTTLAQHPDEALTLSAIIPSACLSISFYLESKVDAEERSDLMAQGEQGLQKKAQRLQKQFGLTERERDVLILLAAGNTASYIASNLNISINTVKTYRSGIYAKMGIHNRQDLITEFMKP